MALDMKVIKQLREETSAPIGAIKEALDEANDDVDAARKILSKRGLKVADKKAGRESKEGIIDSYIHSNGKIGVLVKVMCETDFVARNEEFKTFAHDIALQIAASSPQYVNAEDVPEDVVKEAAEEIREASLKEGKPADVVDKIVEGKIAKIREEMSLMNQTLVKDSEKTVKDLLLETTARLGEKIEIGEFIRFEI